ncbi:MAG: cobalamin B12-binding domain-containing protein [Bacillota bacterium]
MAGRKRRKILAAPLGNDVHVAGILSFLRLAEEQGFDTAFLGPAVGVGGIVRAAQEYRPDVLAVSYRLTPEVVPALVAELTGALQEAGLGDLELIFGGTLPVVRAAAATGVFRKTFSGLEGVEEVIAYLQGRDQAVGEARYPDQLLPRLAGKRPYPLLRHHFGLPSLEETLEGVRQIAASQVLDIISIGPDQCAQDSFFRPEEIDEQQAGAGGVPLRRPEDLRRLYEASRTGNYPLLRIYAGTRDLLQWAELAVETIHNAWAAVPLCWYSELDGRSNRPLLAALEENRAVIAWYAERDIPVEVNEAHHWSLRESPDTIAVVMAYLAAYNAKALGVKDYVAQYMFNTPNGTWYDQDLAKMLAKQELISSLHDESFRSYTQVRTGLASLSPNLNLAKGQLASSIHLALALQPDIVHVVGFCEADHAARPEDVIESCEIVQGVLQNALHGLPDARLDPRVQARKQQLLEEAQVLLTAIRNLGEGSDDPWATPAVLVRAVETGLLDAPHLRGNRLAQGEVETRLIDGACLAINPATGRPISERERIHRLLRSKGDL